MDQVITHEIFLAQAQCSRKAFLLHIDGRAARPWYGLGPRGRSPA